MFASSLIIAAAAFSGLACAQLGDNITYNGQNYSQNAGVYAVPPNTVPASLSGPWCTGQRNTCGQLCTGLLTNNTCDPSTLTYNCSCSGGSSYNLSNYQQTLPAQICLQWRTNCVASHPNDLNAINRCLSVQCGNATVAMDSTSTSASSSSSATPSGTASGGSSGSSPTTSASSSTSSAHSAATALALAQQYGTPLMAGGMVALFGLAL